MAMGKNAGGRSGDEMGDGALMADLKDFRGQDATLFRPYSDEIPWELLLLGDPDEERVAGYVDTDYMRVAKDGDEVAGVYVVEAVTPTRYALLNLVVAPAYRRKGLGAWLLGHAIGLSESKGAREIIVPGVRPRTFFSRVGFAANGSDLLLTLTPE
jgi:ribosomal protein S18 acetylase RimI-like enzyme